MSRMHAIIARIKTIRYVKFKTFVAAITIAFGAPSFVATYVSWILYERTQSIAEMHKIVVLSRPFITRFQVGTDGVETALTNAIDMRRAVLNHYLEAHDAREKAAVVDAAKHLADQDEDIDDITDSRNAPAGTLEHDRVVAMNKQIDRMHGYLEDIADGKHPDIDHSVIALSPRAITSRIDQSFRARALRGGQ